MLRSHKPSFVRPLDAAMTFSLIKIKNMKEKLFLSPNRNLMAAKGMPKWSRLGVDLICKSKFT